jgi:hypothetical protein
MVVEDDISTHLKTIYFYFKAESSESKVGQKYRLSLVIGLNLYRRASFCYFYFLFSSFFYISVSSQECVNNRQISGKIGKTVGAT